MCQEGRSLRASNFRGEQVEPLLDDLLETSKKMVQNF